MLDLAAVCLEKLVSNYFIVEVNNYFNNNTSIRIPLHCQGEQKLNTIFHSHISN